MPATATPLSRRLQAYSEMLFILSIPLATGDSSIVCYGDTPLNFRGMSPNPPLRSGKADYRPHGNASGNFSLWGRMLFVFGKLTVYGEFLAKGKE